MPREATVAVAYVPFKTFLTALDTLKAGIPDPIDRSLFKSQSGSTQAMLVSTFKALGCIDENGHPQPSLERLVDISTRKAALRQVLEATYKDVLSLGKAATQKQFDDCFYAYGVSGDTHKKAKSFFLQAADMAGITLSPHIAAAKSSTSSGPRAPVIRRPRRSNKNRNAGKSDEDHNNHDVSDSGGVLGKLMDKFPDFNPDWPDNIKEKWFDAFGQLRDELKK